jgi:hypothetical protein
LFEPSFAVIVFVLNDLKYKFKSGAMKITAFVLLMSTFLLFSCKDDNTESDRLRLLTGPTWVSDSLLVNRVDASGPTGLLHNFRGDVKFNTDGTGRFGNYSGRWQFAYNETQLILSSDSLPIPLTTKIAELTSASLKITTSFPNQLNPTQPYNIRMTFKPK